LKGPGAAGSLALATANSTIIALEMQWNGTTSTALVRIEQIQRAGRGLPLEQPERIEQLFQLAKERTYAR
jgi:hypothetical protein